LPFTKDSSEEEREKSNRRWGTVHSDHNRQAGCHDNGLPGAGLVKGYGRCDRDDQPRGARGESDRGNVSGELAVLDDESIARPTAACSSPARSLARRVRMPVATPE
jgi:hypothetical protein